MMKLLSEIISLIVSKKKVIFKFILSIIAITFLYYISNYSILKISNEANENINSVKIQKTSTKEVLDNQDQKTISVGFNLVRNGEYIVYATSDDRMTERSVKQKFLSINNLSFQFKPQLKVDLAAQTENSRCVFGQKSKGYYICENDLVKGPANDINSPSNTLGEITIEGNSTNHLSGLLGFFVSYETREKVVRFGFTDGNDVKFIETKDLLSNKLKRSVFNNTILSDQSQNGNFSLVDTIGKKLYYYNTINSDPKVIDYKNIVGDNCDNPQFSLNQGQLLIACRVYDDKKKKDTPGYSHEGADFKNKAFILNISDNSSDDVAINKIVGRGNLDGKLVLTKNSIIVQSLDSLFFISRAQNKLKRIIYSVDNFTTDGSGRVIFTRDESLVFETNELNDESHLLAKSSRLSIKDIALVDNSIVFKGYEDSYNKVSGYYRVTSLERSGITPFDILPYDTNDPTIPVYRSRYKGNDLYFNVKLDSLVFPRDKPQSYSKKELDAKIGIITRRLKRDGLDINKYRLNFLIGP